MAGLTGFEIVTLVFVVVLGVVVVGLLLYLIRRLKSRQAKLLSELDDRPQASQDRAFNRLAMARREAGFLGGQGVNVQRAQELIAEGQGAFDTHHYDRAYQLAQSAHEALVTARQQGSRSTGSALGSGGTAPLPSHATTEGGPAPPSASTGSTAEPPSRPSIPKNQAESQFQIRLLTEELAALPGRRAREPDALQAADWKRQASQAFAQGNYTDAFRFALKGRRALGGPLETLPPPGTAPLPASATTGNGTGAAPDVTSTAETVAGGERCPECGYPTQAGDSFCRGCGRPHRPMTCPTCGAARGADEPFCGRCGARFS